MQRLIDEIHRLLNTPGVSTTSRERLVNRCIVAAVLALSGIAYENNENNVEYTL